MPKVDDAKTKSAPSKKPGYIKGLLITGALLLLLLPTLFYRPATATLKVHGNAYHLDIAATDETRQKGLSGRSSIKNDQGMIFVFDQAKTECFWMKDMQFPLDIIWMDANKEVVYIEKNVVPDTYPESFCPSENAKYVIELGAGQVARSHISVGQILGF